MCAALTGASWYGLRNKMSQSDWVADSITVERGASVYEYTVTINTLECASPIDLIEFEAVSFVSVRFGMLIQVIN